MDERSPVSSAGFIPFQEDGSCLMDKAVTRSRGWDGYCLDPAGLANPDKYNQLNKCALWYPLVTPSGSISVDHLNSTAGYVPPLGSGQFWCVEAKGNAFVSGFSTTTPAYAYTAYKDARQFYPHTANGYNGNSCDNGDQAPCLDKDGQSSCTCPRRIIHIL